MKKKIIDLEIIDDLEEAGASKISLVDQPAINLDWVAFAREEFIYPEAGEDKDTFLGKCIAYNIDEGKPEDQAAAICYRVWDEHSLSKETFARISFDWNDTLSTDRGLALAKRHLEMGDDLYIISALSEPTEALLTRAEELGISKEKIFTTGSNKAKVEKVKDLGIIKHIDNNEDVISDLGPLGIKFAKFAEYPWEECQADQKKRGLSQESADKLCGWIKANMSIDVSGLPPYVDQVPKKKEDLAIEELDVLGYQTEYFYMCPGAIQTFYNLMEEPLDEEYAGMVRAAAVIADKVFEMEAKVIESETVTPDQVRQAIILVEDFKDIIDEINKVSQVYHEVSYMDNHIETIYSYLPKEEEFAAVEELKVGDAVSWKTADQNPRGRIREIVRNGGKTVPGTSFILQGTQDDPGYIIEIYEKKDGKWAPTGKYAGRKADSILKNVELWRQKFALEEDEQILVGPAMIPDMDIPRKDKKTKEVYSVRFSKDVIARIAEKFMRELRNRDTNIQHEDNEAGAYVMETWLVESESDKLNTVYGFNVPVGTWAIKMRVEDPETWQMVKDGKLNGFSIEGSFLDKEDYDKYVRDKQIYEKVMKILKSS